MFTFSCVISKLKSMHNSKFCLREDTHMICDSLRVQRWWMDIDTTYIPHLTYENFLDRYFLRLHFQTWLIAHILNKFYFLKWYQNRNDNFIFKKKTIFGWFLIRLCKIFTYFLHPFRENHLGNICIFLFKLFFFLRKE